MKHKTLFHVKQFSLQALFAGRDRTIARIISPLALARYPS